MDCNSSKTTRRNKGGPHWCGEILWGVRLLQSVFHHYDEVQVVHTIKARALKRIGASGILVYTWNWRKNCDTTAILSVAEKLRNIMARNE